MVGLVRITAGWLVDGRGGPAQPGMGVLVEGDRIVAVADADRLPDPETAVRIDAPGATLLPGLFDAHVHLCFDCGPDPIGMLTSANDDELLAICERSAEWALRAGVTTVRDCGGRGDIVHKFKRRLAARAEPHLRVLASGRALTSKRGHCWFLGGEAESDDDLLRLVDEEIERGADGIKVMATGGGITPGTDPSLPQFEEAAFARAAERVHQAGRFIGCHAHGISGIARVARAGVDIVDHCTFLTPQRPRFDEQVAELVARAGCRIAPTFATLAHPLQSGEMIGNMRKLGLTPPQYFELRADVVRRLRGYGIPIIAGSDAGDIHVPHDSVLTEMSMLVRVGLSVEEAVAAASLEPARATGLADRIGSVEASKLADLLLVDGDLSADVELARQTRLVLKNGQVAFQAT